MTKCIEITETWCECEASIRDLPQIYKIKAEVRLIPAIGWMLDISIAPPLNNISNNQLQYDTSKLPEQMVRDWFKEQIRHTYNEYSFDVITSDKEEHEIEIID